MLMAAVTHMSGSAHSSSSSISPPAPWHPVVLVPNHQGQALDDLDLIVTPSPPTPTTPQRLLPAARRTGKQRRPRPSRKLATTYISADAASFRRMVHQVTGADDVLLPGPAAPDPELLCRPAPAPSRGVLTTTLTLPTLDTSAFLLGAARRGGDRGRDYPPARPGAACRRHGSAVAVGDPGAVLQAEEACDAGGVGGGGGEYSCSNGGSSGGGGFPSLESWDDDAIFQE